MSTPKHFVERVLCGTGLPRVVAKTRRGRTIVLAYHNVVTSAASLAGDHSLHMAQDRFVQQLDFLHENFDVIPLAQVLETSQSSRPRVALTFDDAYQGAVTLGIAEVRRRGLPATIFVPPMFLGGATFWWDALASTEGLSADIRNEALLSLQGRDAAIRAWAEGRSLKLAELSAEQGAATEAQLAQAADTPGISIASHTWEHPNLAMLPEDQLDAELTRPLAWLRQCFGSVIPWLTYPYGLATPAVQRAAERAGYEAALLVDGGWFPRRLERLRRYALPRLNVPAGLSLDGFRLRMAGLFV